VSIQDQGGYTYSGPPPLIRTISAISPNLIGGGFCDKEDGLPGLAVLCREWEQTLIFAAPVEWMSEIKPGRHMTIQGFAKSAWLKRAFVNGILPLLRGSISWDFSSARQEQEC